MEYMNLRETSGAVITGAQVKQQATTTKTDELNLITLENDIFSSDLTDLQVVENLRERLTSLILSHSTIPSDKLAALARVLPGS